MRRPMNQSKFISFAQKMHNFHTHTHFCDGSDRPEAYVTSAISLSFNKLGFSGHAPISIENNFAIPDAKFLDYIKSVRALSDNKSFSEQNAPEIYLSLEFDYIPGITKPFKEICQTNGLDYSIGSVHLVKSPEGLLWFIDGPKKEIYDEGLLKFFENDIKKAVRAYFAQLNEMICLEKPDILGHFDKIKMHNKERYFSTADDWYQKEIDQTLELCKEFDIVIEVNTRGLYKKRSHTTFPGPQELLKIKNAGIDVVISSDAHKPAELALMLPEARTLLIETGFKAERIPDKKNQWEYCAL